MWIFLCVFFACMKSNGLPSLIEEEKSEGLFWQTYSEEWIRNNQEYGYIVYVTADWCITCVLFEQQVLQDQAIQRQLNENNIMPLRADGTREDAEIERLKERYKVHLLPIVIFVRDPHMAVEQHIGFSKDIEKQDILRLFVDP